MKLYNYCLIVLSVFLFLSCEKETEDLSRSTYYVAFHVNGENPAIVQVGLPYEDAGCVATLRGKNVSPQMTTTSNVDADAMGMYKVEYSATNEDGLKSKAIRDVIVCNPTVTTDLGGTWITQEGSNRVPAGAITPVGFIVKIKYLAPGFFSVDDFLGGYYAQGAYPEYGSLVATYGHFSLNEDNSLSMIDGFNDGFGVALSDLRNTSYDPQTGILRWSAIWSGYSFNLILKKQ